MSPKRCGILASLILFGALTAQAQTATLFDCSFTYHFTASTASPGQLNTASSRPCGSWGVTYSTTGFTSVTVQFETSPDNSVWTAVPNSVCSSSQQPPCVIFGANPISAGKMGIGAFRSYGKYVRVNVTGVSGTGAGDIVVYGYKGLSAAISSSGGAAGPPGPPGPTGPAGPIPWVRPESFGAVGGTCLHDDTVAIQAALDSVGSTSNDPTGAGSVVLAPGNCYLTSAVLNINHSYVNFFSEGLGMAQSSIKTTATTGDIIKFNGSGTGNCAAGSIFWSSLSNITLARSTPATAGNGVNIVKGCWVKVEEVLAFDSVNNFHVQLSANTLLQRDQGGWTSSTGVPRTGYFIDSSSAGANNSTRLKHAIVAGGVSQITGFLVSGDDIADTFIDDAETSQTDYGIRITATSPPNGDIHITNAILDRTAVQGIQVNDVFQGGNSSVMVNGGMVFASSGNAVDIENSQGVTIANMQLSAPGGDAVLINGGNSLLNVIHGNVIQSSDKGIETINASVNTLSLNTITAPSATPATAHIVIGPGSNANMCSYNQLSGYAATGISLNATSAGQICYPNIVDPTHITTPISDAGTGNLTQGITASGSSCAITAMIQGIVTAATCIP